LKNKTRDRRFAGNFVARRSLLVARLTGQFKISDFGFQIGKEIAASAFGLLAMTWGEIAAGELYTVARSFVSLRMTKREIAAVPYRHVSICSQ
jgi:hypothetical protein